MLRPKSAKWSVAMAVLVFGVQAVSLMLLAMIYPPSQYRTGLFQPLTYGGATYNFLGDPLSYFGLLSFVIGFALLNFVSHKGGAIVSRTSAEPDIGARWGRLFDLSEPVAVSFALFVVIFILLRTQGIVETVEPAVITVVWTLDDFVALVTLVALVFVGVRVARFIGRDVAAKIVKIDPSESMGGWAGVGRVVTLNALMVGLVSGIWLLPWVLFGTLRSASLSLSATGVVLLNAIGAVFVIATVLLPLGLLGFGAYRLKLAIGAQKSRLVSDLKGKIATIETEITKYADLSAPGRVSLRQEVRELKIEIESVRKIKEFPLDTSSLGTIGLSVVVQLVVTVMRYSVHV